MTPENTKSYKIYKYTNLITGMSYIGQTCRTLKQRAGCNMIGYRGCEKFWEAIEHYGTDCWSVEILWDGLTLDEANIYEQIEIRDNNTLFPHGYNLAHGGNIGKHSLKTRQKMSEARRGAKNPNYGKKHNMETRRKMSGENHHRAWTGKSLSPEHKKKISEKLSGRTGRKHSPETKKKISAAHSGKSLSPETKKKISEKLSGRTGEKHPNTLPEYIQAKWFFFLQLPINMDISEKRKRLYNAFDYINRKTLWGWANKWQHELEYDNV